MRVLMVSKACIHGAYQRKLEELANCGVELTVVVPPSWRDHGGQVFHLDRQHTQGYRLTVEPLALNGHFHTHFYPQLGRHFQGQRWDVVHADEEPYNLATLQIIALARRSGARALFFTWQNLLHRYPLPVRLIERYCYGRVAGAIAGNGEARTVLRRKGYAGLAWVIPQFGVDPELFAPRGAPRPSPNSVFRVGYVGRLEHKKGVHLLVAACARLGGGVQLDLLGWGPEEPRLRALASACGMAERLHIHTARASTEVPAFLRQLDALVLPSLTTPQWKEQFGRALVEAMACETPVIGSDSGEIQRVIGDAGLLFPEGNTAELTEQLARLRGDPALRRELGVRGRQRVQAHYTQKRIAEQTWQAYQALSA
ncbi:MAG: glycosyl transferase family 1 [Dehalococcoidia bacterium]|nr:glycosyl transferase family 1 [Dehalococcoidia bacterium]